MDALAGIPAWAVYAAVQSVLRGDTDVDQRFAPTPPQIASLSMARLRQVMSDLTTLKRLELATIEWVPTPAERDRVAAGFERLKMEIAR